MPKVVRLHEMAKELREQHKNTVESMLGKEGFSDSPCLAILQVVGDTASDVYTKHKKEAVLDIGGTIRHFLFKKDIDPREVRRVINDLNHDPHVHGIMLQLPVPWTKNEREKTLNAIVPYKDVDGLSRESFSAIVNGDTKYHYPCTAKAVMEIISKLKGYVSGLNVLIVGRSRLVGKPLALILEDLCNCTVTLAHSHTFDGDISYFANGADVVVVATGTPRGIKFPDIDPNVTIIDVGINKDEAGVLCGDVDHATLNPLTVITAAPGGVGLITVEMLCANLIDAWEYIWESKKNPSF